MGASVDAVGLGTVVPMTRDPWLDNIKMTLVTLVVIGHSWGLLGATSLDLHLYDFLYYWHIPAFVLITGHLSRSFTWDRRHFSSLFTTIVLPYLIFELALLRFRESLGQHEQGPVWLQPHWAMIPLSVGISLLGGLYDELWFGLPRILGLLPFFVLGLHLKPRHLKHLDDVWVRLAAVPSLVGIGIMAVYTDTWAETALLWYDTGYNEIPIDNEIVFQTRLTIMMVGLLGAFAAMSLVPRRSLGWFTTMGTATMVVYLFHGFVIKTVKLLGWPDFTSAHPWLGLVLTILGAIVLTLVLASPPVRRVLEPFTNPLGWAEGKRRARRPAPTSA